MNRVAFFFLLLVCFSCESKQTLLADMDHNEDAEKFVIQALEQAGTLEKWRRIKKISFVKETTMYLPDSSVESHSIQKQYFSNYPNFKAEIIYLEDSLKRRMIQNDSEVKYFQNGKRIDEKNLLDKAKTNLITSYYVIALPFKLADDHMRIEEISNTTLLNGKNAISIQVQHFDMNKKAKNEKWWHYFNPESKIMEGYNIAHDNRHSYILNDSQIKIHNFYWPIRRRSIALDNNQQNPYLRASYTYSDWEIEW